MRNIFILLFAFISSEGFAQWNLNGNTVGSEKFIGTLDTFDFPIRVNNVELFRLHRGVGQVEVGSTRGNLFIGKGCGLIFNTTQNWDGSWGDSTTAIGVEAMKNATGSRGDVAIGYQASYKATCGAGNIAIGFQALYNNRRCATGKSDANTAIGYQALFYGQAIIGNTAIGSYALFNLLDSTGQNDGIGYAAGYNTTYGKQNVYIGAKSGYSNTTYHYNVAIGYSALYSNSSGGQNTAIGWGAMKNGSGNALTTAIGYAALVASSGSENVAIGADAGHSNTSGTRNTFIGNQAGYSITTASRSVFIGFNAGIYETTSDKVYIGHGLYSNGVINESTGRRRILFYGYQGADSTTSTGRINGTLVVTGTGNNGFGVTTASERLTVAGRIRSTNSDIVVESNSRGIILKDTQSPAHYWRITISAGALAITDLGTSLPSE